MFAEAYQALADLVSGRGVDIDELLINVTSIETHAGPGLRLWVRHEIPGDPSSTQNDEADETTTNRRREVQQPKHWSGRLRIAL